MHAVIEVILDGIFKCLYWPLCYRRDRNARRRSEIRRGYRPNPNRPPLRSRVNKRRRALTLPGNDELVFSQTCLLLAKVPTELRQQIWREYLGGLTFHLELRRTRERNQAHLCHTLCRSPNPGSCDESHGSKGCWRIGELLAPEMPKQHILSLLLACRQIYSEAIRYLYAHNTFTTVEPDVVQYFSCFLLPQRITSIRSFRFRWYPTFPSPQCTPRKGPLPKILVWTAIWKSFAEMRGLDELHVKLATLDYESWERLETEEAILILKPLMEVTIPRVFELSLPFPCGSDEAPWKALPCQIRRTRGVDDL